MTNQLITYRLPIDYSLISLMSLMSSISNVWYDTIGRIYLSACGVSRGLLRGIEKGYMKGTLDTAASAVLSTYAIAET